MKRMRLFVLLLMVFLLCVAFPAYAELLKIGTASYDSDGNGTPEEYNLIYMADGPFGPVTWLDYSRGTIYNYDLYDLWQNQVAWAAGLGSQLTVTLNPGYSTSTDWSTGWRLPETVDGPPVFGYDGTTAKGYNITTSEMGYLFYTELGNKGYYDTNGNRSRPGSGLVNAGVFDNLYALKYWSGTANKAYSSAPHGLAWRFDFYDGGQHNKPTDGEEPGFASAMAVHPGDVSAAVPEPGTFLLFGAGLAGLGAWRNKFRRRLR